MPQFPEMSRVLFSESIGLESQHRRDRGLYDYSLYSGNLRFQRPRGSSNRAFAETCACGKDDCRMIVDRVCWPTGGAEL